jgi:adenosylcobinamide hydrolase
MVDAGTEALSALLWRFDSPLRVVASGPLGGGLGRRSWVLNAQVDNDYGRMDPASHLRDIAGQLGLRGEGVGMLTAVDTRRVSTASVDEVRVDATVGVTHPVWAAGSGVISDHTSPGTINIVARLPVRLVDAALVNAVATVAEAKAQALWDAGIAATGTASDALCVAVQPDGPVWEFGGPRSEWGSRLARAVHNAVMAGLEQGGSR